MGAATNWELLGELIVPVHQKNLHTEHDQERNIHCYVSNRTKRFVWRVNKDEKKNKSSTGILWISFIKYPYFNTNTTEISVLRIYTSFCDDTS